MPRAASDGRISTLTRQNDMHPHGETFTFQDYKRQLKSLLHVSMRLGNLDTSQACTTRVSICNKYSMRRCYELEWFKTVVRLLLLTINTAVRNNFLNNVPGLSIVVPSDPFAMQEQVKVFRFFSASELS